MKGACEQFEERLVGLLYEEGDEAEGARVRAHLAECAGCRREYEQLGSTRELLGAWPNVANAPRIVYVHEEASAARPAAGGWRAGFAGRWSPAVVAPLAAAATLVLALLGAWAVLDLQLGPDGVLQVGRLASDPTPPDPASTPVTRAQLQEGLAEVVAVFDEALAERDREQRRLLLAAIDERMQEQGLSMGAELRGVVDTALTDLQRQHEGDLGLIFAAIDEMGMFTASELQRINTVLGSLAMAGPGY